MANMRVIIGLRGVATQVEQEELPEGGTPQVPRPPGSSAHNPVPDSVRPSGLVPGSVRPSGVVATHTIFPEHGKYPPVILDILVNNWHSKNIQGRVNTLERVVSLKAVVSDVKTVGSLPFERWESSQRECPTRPLKSEVEESYSCLHWYAISRVGSHLLKSKKDDANIGQEKKREALRDRFRESSQIVANFGNLIA